MLNGIINQDVVRECPIFAQRFASATPFRHVVIDNFLEPDFCAALLQQFPSFDEKAAINENGEIGGKSTQERVRALGKEFCRLDDVVQRADFLKLIEDITGIEKLQYDPYYFGGGTHENREGQDLDAHVDFNYHPVTRQHRRLNLIIYMNEEWQDEWGGSLQLHRDPYLDPREDDILTVTPLFNRCVIFETNEYSWHGFERIQLPEGKKRLSRKSFALYFYTDSRPAKETSEEHSTVYVERHLPPRFVEGMRLGSEDVQQVRLLLARRDQHLKRLYRNIQRLYGEVNRLRLSQGAGVAGAASEAGSPIPDVAAAERMVLALRNRVQELEQSTSWRVTAPIRAIKRMLARRG
jgi:2OG-Fe(II) oxygenase superfamily